MGYCHDCSDYHAGGDPRCALNREAAEEQYEDTAPIVSIEWESQPRLTDTRHPDTEGDPDGEDRQGRNDRHREDHSAA